MSSLLQLSDVADRVSNDNADLLRRKVADLLGRNSISFPGAQPVSFARTHLKALQDTEYVICTDLIATTKRCSYYLCEKTDGIRCLLYLTFYLDGDDTIEAHLLIDRKNDYYNIDNPHFHFPMPEGPVQHFHTETLLDGELVLDTMPNGELRRTYLVFDCLALDGAPLLQRHLDKRLGYFFERVLKPYNELLKKYPEEKEEQPFTVIPKKMEKSYGIQMMFQDVLPNLPHGNDGLIFTCRTSPYVTGTDQNIIKWKPPHENTVDFRLELGDFPTATEMGETFPDYDACPDWDLLVWHGEGRNKYYASLHVTEDEWDSMKSMGQMLDGRIIECYKDEQGRWRFKREPDGTPRFRDDKQQANHIKTVESVLSSIEDAVTEQDLLDHVRAINVAWKRREAEQRGQVNGR